MIVTPRWLHDELDELTKRIPAATQNFSKVGHLTWCEEVRFIAGRKIVMVERNWDERYLDSNNRIYTIYLTPKRKIGVEWTPGTSTFGAAWVGNEPTKEDLTEILLLII